MTWIFQSTMITTMNWDSFARPLKSCGQPLRTISLKCGDKLKNEKALNAAFAHDLRTPLTVLKGYNEMLQASDNSQTRETAATMGKHISRMENYVSSMSNIRRMEDTQMEYKLIGLQPLVSSLYDSAKIICTKNGKELILQNDISVLQLSLDSAFISQVCNNLISTLCGMPGL